MLWNRIYYKKTNVNLSEKILIYNFLKLFKFFKLALNATKFN